jgi:hypothetical protein
MTIRSTKFSASRKNTFAAPKSMPSPAPSRPTISSAAGTASSEIHVGDQPTMRAARSMTTSCGMRCTPATHTEATGNICRGR